MTFLFRAEAGPGIGLGHLSRSLSLAAALKRRGAESFFAVNLRGGNLEGVDLRGFSFTEVKEPGWEKEDFTFTDEMARRHKANALVVDSRNAPDAYLAWLVEAGHFVICRDDQAIRALPCQAVLNGNADAERLPYNRTRKGTRFLLGPEFTVLPQQFWDVPKRKTNDTVQNLLIVLGGTDPHGLMPALIKLFDELPIEFSVTAVLGPFFSHPEEFFRAAHDTRKSITCVKSPPTLFPLMSRADLAISGGGQTLYELASVGCPTIALEVAPDQRGQMRALQEEGILRVAGKAKDPDLLVKVHRELLDLANNPELRSEMARKGQERVDGQGAQRAARQFIEELEALAR